METPIKNILVPWDFTQLSYYALQQAIELSKITNYRVFLLHIIEKSSDEASAQKKLELIQEEVVDKYGVKPGIIIKVGNIFETITDVANEPDSGLVIMKTDGVKGMQKYTGSRAIKIISGSKVPFIVLQTPPKKPRFEKILYPIDYRIENKQVLSYILYLTKYYHFKIYLMRPQTNDKLFKKNIANTINTAKYMLDSKNIEYEVVTAERKKDYCGQIINFAHTNDIDLILILLEKNLTLTKFLFGMKEQRILANEHKIPVMCLNPKLELLKYAGFH